MTCLRQKKKADYKTNRPLIDFRGRFCMPVKIRCKHPLNRNTAGAFAHSDDIHFRGLRAFFCESGFLCLHFQIVAQRFFFE